MSTAVLIVLTWALVDVLIVTFVWAAGARRRRATPCPPRPPVGRGLVFKIVGGHVQLLG